MAFDMTPIAIKPPSRLQHFPDQCLTVNMLCDNSQPTNLMQLVYPGPKATTKLTLRRVSMHPFDEFRDLTKVGRRLFASSWYAQMLETRRSRSSSASCASLIAAGPVSCRYRRRPVPARAMATSRARRSGPCSLAWPAARARPGARRVRRSRTRRTRCCARPPGARGVCARRSGSQGRRDGGSARFRRPRERRCSNSGSESPLSLWQGADSFHSLLSNVTLGCSSDS